ncbi:5-formyltetrahydrofolate cyclo-ligase [Microcella alkaliphila]|uniref:5-formyltetrahydrofolate cyclo-ligase n=1 Tax=Microcella alkaliphila TaxID=279828 RepID=A0A0U5BBF4_9MICO|nr:5-formyltetrahydrofolate cyclo-ligase [Microcella alkaliphila]BAU31567.1 5-formyltetrahydrofolate cyclo-ligase-related pr otein [Microcella alkaliphila]
MSSDPVSAKRALRAELRERRRIRPAPEREASTASLTTQLIALTQSLGARTVACYLSTPDEPDTRAYLAWARENGVDVLLPVSRDDGLLDWAAYDSDDEGEDVLGMPVPLGGIVPPIMVNEVGLMLVPAAACDTGGMRMGWGRGYFDKTLGSMDNRPPVFAVLFDDEIVDALPHEPHDQPVDGVVTPGGIRRF